MRIRTWWLGGLLLAVLTVAAPITTPGNMAGAIQKPGGVAHAIQKPGHGAVTLATANAAMGYALGG